MKQVFLVLFTITSLIHLYDSWNDDSKRRARTKPFLLLLLLLFYVAATKRMNVYLVLALAFSWLGDVLLIPKGHKWFTMGGISFIFSHVFFILTYLPNVSLKAANWLIVIPMAVIYYGISLFIMHVLRPTTPKSMVLPMRFYLLCNSTMNVVSLLQLMTCRSFGAWVAFAGALLFFVSDCCLFLVRYYKKPEIIFRKHFTVMLAYLRGELLIVLGILSIMG